MIVIAHPRSGSSWFCRVLADAAGVYLVNGNMPGNAEDGSLFRNMRAYHASADRDVSLLVKLHVESPERLADYDIDFDGKKVFIFRDPRDVMVSYFFFKGFRERARRRLRPRNIAREAHDLFTGERRWRPNMFRWGAGQREEALLGHFIDDFLPEWKSFTTAWLDTPVPSVRYEDLKEEPAGEYSRVLKTLGFDVPPEDVERSIHKFSVDRFKEQVGDPQLPSERRMVRTGSSGDWRRHFNEEHKALVKRIAGDLLVALGYERDHEW